MALVSYHFKIDAVALKPDALALRWRMLQWVLQFEENAVSMGFKGMMKL
jgi:hypothetical protein